MVAKYMHYIINKTNSFKMSFSKSRVRAKLLFIYFTLSKVSLCQFSNVSLKGTAIMPGTVWLE